METKGLSDIAHFREYFPYKDTATISKVLEDVYMTRSCQPTDVPMPPNVASTISIAISHDGQYIATTHGDHTVKIFSYHSFKLVREFVGHPRTPWTVKFHPIDSDKVVSGCLGGQVRFLCKVLANMN